MIFFMLCFSHGDSFFAESIEHPRLERTEVQGCFHKSFRKLPHINEGRTMIMKKHLAAVLLLISTVILAAFPVQASTKSKTYKAYKTWISKGAKDSHGDKYNKFCLVNIDADKIPELVATSSNYGISTYYILSCKGNRLVSLTMYGGVSGTGGYRGNSMYRPSKGRLLAISASSGGRGSIQHTVYKLTKNGFSKYIKDSGKE